MAAEHIAERPTTLSLVEPDDGDPMRLTKGDWRGLWRRFDQLHLAQQELGDQMGGVRTTVHGVQRDMGKVLVATTDIEAKLSSVSPKVKVMPIAVAVAAVVIAFCALAITGRHMGWW